MKGAHETKAAEAPTAQPRASAEIKSLTGTPWWERLQNLHKLATQPITTPQGPAGINGKEKTLRCLPGPWNSHIWGSTF